MCGVSNLLKEGVEMLFLNQENEIYIEDMSEQLDKSVASFAGELAGLRAGRANPRLLDKLMVEYYGTMTPVNQMANIMCPDPRTIVISPWDATTIREIMKAIQASDLGLNPSEDGKVVRLSLPILTEERRKELVKTVRKMCEDRKVAMRNLRRDCIDIYRKLKKDSKITENELEVAEKEIQKILDNATGKVDAMTKDKENELMEV